MRLIKLLCGGYGTDGKVIFYQLFKKVFSYHILRQFQTAKPEFCMTLTSV